MPKHITLGNGSLLIGLDKYARVKDLYYHYAGLENHIGKDMVHKVGFWVDGNFKWLEDSSWDIVIGCEKGTMASNVTATNKELGIEVYFTDVIYNEKDVFVREVGVKNLDDKPKNVKVFFNQQFNISQSHIGDTAYYDPDTGAIVHYKGRRVFLINLECSGSCFNQYGTGLFGIEGKSGTFKDAEDGELHNNPIEHGQVDSVLGIEISLSGVEKKTMHYWVIASKSIRTAREMNEYVKKKGPRAIIKSTKDYWKAWVHNQNFSFYGLSENIIDLFNKSLVQIRTHVSNNGCIIASSDSDLLQFGRDTYSYMWPRDAAFSSIALARAGDFNASRRFFEFCNKVITDDGYFMHKYRPDHSLGSSWHPWVEGGKKHLPIQEDETALVIFALGTHYELSKDLEFVESIYNSLVKKAAEFMVEYRDKKTGLPKPSYDLWEEKYGVSTFTSSSVYGALSVASNFAKMLGKDKYALRYSRAAEKVKKGILAHLYDEESGLFHRMIRYEDGVSNLVKTLDMSSVYGVYRFGVLPPNDGRLKRAMEISRDRLWVNTDIGGIARYEGDKYLKVEGNTPGNPWVITTLWHIQYLLEFLSTEAELPDLVSRFKWAVDRALPSGVLSEQINPYTGEPLSATPLVWSHSEYVITIIKYLEKLEELGICKACYPVSR